MVLILTISESRVARVLGVLPASSRVPSLATDEVASVLPRHGVLATLAHCVLSGATAVRPPRVEVAVVRTLRVGGGLALLQKSGRVDIVTLSEEVEWGSEHAGGCHRGEKKGLERDHFE
jgi:hypothetical protein